MTDNKNKCDFNCTKVLTDNKFKDGFIRLLKIVKTIFRKIHLLTINIKFTKQLKFIGLKG